MVDPYTDLRKTSIEFRRVASRLLRTTFNDEHLNLTRLMVFIRETPILRDYIEHCLKKAGRDYGISSLVRDRRWGENLPIPSDKEGEIAFTYQLLAYLWQTGRPEAYQNCALGYASGNHIPDHVAEFNRVVVAPFVTHLADHINEVMIDMGCSDAAAKVSVRGNVGQVNLASGGSAIVASSSYSQQAPDDGLPQMIGEFLAALKTTSIPPEKAEDRETLTEILEAIRDSIGTAPPKKGLIKVAIEKITGLVGHVAKDAVAQGLALALLERFKELIL